MMIFSAQTTVFIDSNELFRANYLQSHGHNPQQYLSVLLTELPALGTFDEIDQLLPWAISPAEIAARYKGYPAP